MITRKDIANKVGVSVSVVSRALNNSGYVNSDKRKEILRVAEELGYHPNPVAMSLQQRRTKQILFYSKDLNNQFNIELYEGMLDEAEESGYMVMMNGRFNFDMIPKLMIDGIILPNHSVTAKYLEQIGKNYYLPVVTAAYGDEVYFSKAVPLIDSDLYTGMKDALHYLESKGHSKIAMVSPYSFHEKCSRVNAWKEFMKCEFQEQLERYFLGICIQCLSEDHRIMRFMEEYTARPNDVWEQFYEKGRLAADIFMERKLDATAVICFNDEMALGFCKGMKDRGMSIPKDLSVMGIDGILDGEKTEPKLTTLKVDARQMGKMCVRELLSILDRHKEKQIIHIPTTILERDSVRDIRI